MRKAVFKDFIRNIKGSLGRFFAIMAIVAIGVAFFAGVTASSGDMKHSSDSYYDEYNMNDIRILSSIGWYLQVEGWNCQPERFRSQGSETR